MKKNLITNNNVGKQVYDCFEEKMSRKKDLFNKRNRNERLVKASKITRSMPKVTMTLVEKGIADKIGDPKIIHVFRPNIYSQDYAFFEGSLDKMTIETCLERGEAAAEYNLYKSSNILDVLNKKGKKIYDFLEAMQESAMIESAYYSRIGNEEMNEQVRRDIDIAIMYRGLDNYYLNKAFVHKEGVDKNDPLALLDLSKEIDFTGFLRRITITDPYFNRRQKQIREFKNINSDEGFNWEDNKKGKLDNKGTVSLVEHLLGKERVPNSLIDKVKKHLVN